MLRLSGEIRLNSDPVIELEDQGNNDCGVREEERRDGNLLYTSLRRRLVIDAAYTLYYTILYRCRHFLECQDEMASQ